MRELILASSSDFGRCWKRLFLTGIAYQLLAFILLTPLVSVLFRIFVSASGKTLLADQDILFFFLSPLGWLCLISVGSLWLGITALQIAGMMAIVADSAPNGMRPVQALRYAMKKTWPVIKLTARVVLFSSLSVVPFLGLTAAVYFALLGEFDINFYLTKKPPVFFVAVGIAAIIVISMGAVLLRLFAGWAFALPMVLFENVRPAKALGLSRERATGQRRKLLFWIFGWFLAMVVLSAIATSVVVWAGRYFIPLATGSLQLLSFTLGIGLVVWSLVNLVVSLLSSTTLATLGFHLYRQFGRGGDFDATPLKLAESTGDMPGFQLTRVRLLLGCLAGLVIALVTGYLAINSVELEDHVDVIAHRGASKAAPENTIASVRKAIVDGADWVEIDVQETADGTVVVFHDSDFQKLAGMKLKIWDATMNDLKNIDIGSWFAPEFKDERVPTLGEVLDTCKGKVGLFIELKYYGHDVELEQKVVELVEAHGMSEHVVIISLKVAAIQKMKSLRPDWKTGLLMSAYAGSLAELDADFLAVNASFASRSFIRSANRMGKDVCVWTVNDPIGMSTMIGRGVRCIITDKPSLARSVIQQRAGLSAPERLLLELASFLGVAPEIGQQ
ncbi:MAG: glycerophosphoryl diester phosphodiesterase [Mariniblastus sp.]|jgi:glycerophosphoryl diester phosphodiesterase